MSNIILHDDNTPKTGLRVDIHADRVSIILETVIDGVPTAWLRFDHEHIDGVIVTLTKAKLALMDIMKEDGNFSALN